MLIAQTLAEDLFVASADTVRRVQTTAVDLAPSARSNPTAFQAVSFQQPIPIYENRVHDGIQA